MFHWTDNLYFGRRANGDVRILKLRETPYPWPSVDGDYPTATLDITVPADQWGSIVASVSHAGETAGRWQEAMKFHNGTE